MYDAVLAEQANVPTAALCNQGFINDARSAASSKLMPGLRSVPESVPCECTIPAQIAAGAQAAADDIVAALTAPLTEEERSPRPKEPASPSRIVFTGDLQETNMFFYKRGWTDGWPIIPPTEEAVREMLRGTDLPPDHVVAKIIPRLGKATVEKIAINAVMAGALPTYMPILIAAVQALMDPKHSFGVHEVSTGSWVPFYIVNGPIRRQLHINSGGGALSPGDIANAAIGRAMSLIVKNIGGVRKGIEDMGVLGNPGKYTMVIAENEEDSPWEPYHVEQGFGREDSCVSVTFPNSFPQTRPYGTGEQAILRGIISNIVPATRGLTLVLIPPHAQILAQAGWTKKAFMSYIAEYARVPAYRGPTYWGRPDQPLSSRGPTYFGYHFDPAPRPLDALDSVRAMLPENARVIVAGGPGTFFGLFGGGGSRLCVTKKVELPRDWNSLVRKYKDVVPNHVRY